MTGYRVVFDRDRMVLGWKASDCNEALDTNTFPVTPRGSTKSPPVSSEVPEATSKNDSSISGATSILGYDLSHLKSVLILIFLQGISFP